MLVQLHSRITMRKVIAVGGTAGFLVVGHEAGWLRTASLGTVLFALLGAFAASELVTAIVPARRSQAGVNVRVATQLAAASVVIYLTGCGPVLGAGYLYLVADAFRKSGARAERPLLVWLVVCIAAGQAAIAAGTVPTLIAPPLVHGVALLVAAGLLFGVEFFGAAARHQERAEGALRASEERFRALVQRSADLVAIAQGDGMLTYASPASETLLGYTPEELVGRCGLELVDPDDAHLAREMFRRVCESPGRAVSGDVRLLGADGLRRCVEFSATNMLDDGSVAGIVVNVRDVTERRAIEEQLIAQESRDSLTALANRRFFVERVGTAVSRMALTSNKAAVLVVDLDRFDLINDSAGHGVGDEVLVAVAERLEACVRPGDLVARLGGDEFAVLLGNVLGPDDVVGVASRVAAAIRDPFVLRGRELFLTCSVGVALCQPDAEPERVLGDAHLAMHAAKNRGGGGYELFDASLSGSVRRRIDLEAELRRAIERQEFVVHYQPVVDLREDAIVGFEALVRWNHPHRGLVLPGEFIPFAEQTGTIDGLGYWVLAEACRQAQEWPAGEGSPPFALHVNLSAHQLLNPALRDQVTAVLEETGMAPSRLVLEITETVVMQDPETSVAVIDRIRQDGVRFAIDDFGNGYSSFAYLSRLPVEVLKLDHVLIDGLAAGLDDAAVVETVVTLAHRMGMTAVAEGVERPAQREALRALGCDMFQGFCFGPALPADQAEALLRR